MKAAIFAIAMAVLVSAPALSQSASTQLVEASLAGIVADQEDLGLGGVEVKIFVDGFVKGAASSGGDGSYRVAFTYDELGDQSVIAWWIPQAGYVPEIAVLRESTRSKELGLWSSCLPRVDLSSSVMYDIAIYTEDEKFEALGESDCMKTVANTD